MENPRARSVLKQFHSEWIDYLKNDIVCSSTENTLKKYIEEHKSGNAFPAPKLLFKTFRLNPKAVKVVILGQDPYNTGNHADGLAFSTQQMNPPYSLQIMMKEIYRSMYTEERVKIDELFCCGDLSQWHLQGVFLLNTILSVGEEPLSHKDLGWQRITTKAIEVLSSQQHKICFILLGKNAQEYKPLIKPHHLVIQATHPAAERHNGTFIGSNVFLKAKEFAKENYRVGINWGIWPMLTPQIKFYLSDKIVLSVPWYFELYFQKAFGKNWIQQFNNHKSIITHNIRAALPDLKFRHYALNTDSMYYEQSNFEKIIGTIGAVCNGVNSKAYIFTTRESNYPEEIV